MRKYVLNYNKIQRIAPQRRFSLQGIKIHLVLTFKKVVVSLQYNGDNGVMRKYIFYALASGSLYLNYLILIDAKRTNANQCANDLSCLLPT